MSLLSAKDDLEAASSISNIDHPHPFVDHFFQRPLDEHPQGLARAAAPWQRPARRQ